jgi:tetratricopeptide (TPR) repeat protein
MAEKTIRYQPFKATDGDYEPLLRFARTNAPLLDPRFDPPDTRGPEWVKPEREERYWTRRGWSVGDDERGFAVELCQTIEPQYDGVAESSVSVAAYGLQDGIELSVTCRRSWFDPRYLEIRVKGPAGGVEGVADAFERDFRPIADRVPEPDELDTELIGIRSALRRRQWDAVKMRADYVLRFRPEDPEALFALGVASGATGDVKRALELLSRAVEIAPGHADAWYNLGVAYIESGNPEKAVEALERALSLSPGTPEAKKQLSRARRLLKPRAE